MQSASRIPRNYIAFAHNIQCCFEELESLANKVMQTGFAEIIMCKHNTFIYSINLELKPEESINSLHA